MSITSAVRGRMEFLFADFLGTPLWMWSAFISIVAALLVFDVGVLHRDNHVIGVRESLGL